MTLSTWKNWSHRLFRSRSNRQARRAAKTRAPYRRRLHLEWLEERIAPTVNLITEYPGNNFTTSGASSVPPDTEGAAGPNSYIETTNTAITIFSPKNAGTPSVTSNLDSFLFTVGGLPHIAASDGTADAFSTYDPIAQRFIVGEINFDTSNTNGEGNALLIAVSKSSDPTTLTTSDWNFFQVVTTETGVALQDYPGNIGFNADALVITLNSFSSSADLHTQVNAISMSALTSGTPLVKGTNYFQTDISDILARPATMPDAQPGGPMWFMSAANSGGEGSGQATTLDVIEMTNVLSASPTFTTTTLAVNPYFLAVSPKQPNGQAITSAGFTDSRILNVSEANGQLVGAQIVSDSAGDQDSVQWYQININSGTPVMQQQGDLGNTPGLYLTYPGIAINQQGDIGMSYMQSGTAAGQFLSVYVTGRTPADPAGTMEAPVLAQAGAGNYVETTGFGNPPEYRLGDMSGITVDSDGTFWIANEYADSETGVAANYGTAIANFSLGAPITILNFGGQEGVPLVNVPVATFLDNSGVGLNSYQVTINWGDGTVTSGKVKAIGSAGNTFEVLGSHTYTEEGLYDFSVSVNNGTITLGPVTQLISVADAPLSGSAQVVNGSVGTFMSGALIAIFTDSDTTNLPFDPQGDPIDYSATIQMDQGNGLLSTFGGQIVPLFGNTYAVYANSPFSFAVGGLFNAAVTIRDVGGAVVTINSSVSVANNPAIPPLVPVTQTDTGPFNGGFVSLEDALTNLLMSEQLFMVAVAFGTPAQQQNGFANLMNAFTAYELAVFNFDMTLPGS